MCAEARDGIRRATTRHVGSARRRHEPSPFFLSSASLHLGRSRRTRRGSTLLPPGINVAPAQTPCHEKTSLSFPEIRAAKNAPSFKVCARKTTLCSRPEFFSRTNSRRVGSVCRRSRPSPPPLRPESRPASKDVFRENAARSKTSHAHAQKSRAVRHPHAVPRKDCSPLPEGGGTRHRCPSACRPKNDKPFPCFCLPPSRRLRPPAASLLLRAALHKRRRLPNLSFQRRTNDARHNSRLSRAQRNALLPPFGDFSSQSGAVLRSEACTSEKRCPSCLPCPEKSLSAAAEAVFATDRLPSRFRQKAPHSAGKRPLRPASEFPRSFRSHERSGHRGPPQLPRLHSVRMPARLLHSTRLLRSDSASAFRLGFCIHAQFSHSDSTSASRRNFSLPEQCPHSATPLKRRLCETVIPPPLRCPSASGAVAPRRPFVRFLKRKSPLERGPFS